jgi:hypothetical protein
MKGPAESRIWRASTVFGILGSATAVLAVVAAWPFRRGTARTDAGQQADVDGRDWIYGDGATRKSAGRAGTPVEEAPPADPVTIAADEDATREQLLEETRQRAEVEAKTIVARAEQTAREIVAAAVPAEAESKTEAAHPATDEALEDAQKRAREILAAAKTVEARVSNEAERAGALLLEERTKLASFLRELLEEVEGAGALDPQVVNLDQARELKQSVGNSD